MPEIRNKIILDDQMSVALKVISDNAKGVIEALGGIPDVMNEAIDYFKLAKEQTIAFYEATEGSFEHVKETTVEMLESFEVAKEKIVEMTEKIEDKSEAIEGVAQSVDKVGKSSGAASKGMGQIAQAGARLGSSLGLIPRHVSQGVKAVTQLNRAMGATIPTAAKLTTFLGPFTLIATAAMAIVNTVSVFRRGAEEKALPAFDEMIDRADKLNVESNRLSNYLNENIRLLGRLEEIGESETLISYFRNLNDEMEQEIQFLSNRVAFITSEAVDLAFKGLGGSMHRGLTETLEVRNYLDDIQRALIGYIDTSTGEIIAPLYLIHTEINKIYETGLEWTQRTIEQALGRGAIYAHERAEIDELLYGYLEFARMASESTNPEHIGLIENVRNTIESYNELLHALGEVEDQYTTNREMAECAIESYDRMNNAMAAISTATQRHIIRAYRDTYAVAESLRSAHYTLSHAINGTSSEYMSQLDIFNKVMNLSPEYLNFLFDEHGALQDVEDAVYAVTQAQIDLMGIRQANAFLDTIAEWNAESGALIAYTGVVDLATESMWDLVEARIALLKTDEAFGEESYGRVRAVIEGIRNITVSAQGAAREGGVIRPDTINTAAGRAMVVADPANWEIRDEIVRLKEDVATRQFAGGAYQQRAPFQLPTIQLPAIQVYASPGMNEEQLARRTAEYCMTYVVDGIMEACNNDLLVAQR